METRFIEATNGFNWGKFMIAQFTAEEWARREQIKDTEEGVQGVVRGRGWTPKHVLIVDLQTGEGAIFLPGGHVPADLDKHAVWVCPMFEPFLEKLWAMVRTGPLKPDSPYWLESLPSVVNLTDAEAPSALAGYRRPGPAKPTCPDHPDATVLAGHTVGTPGYTWFCTECRQSLGPAPFEGPTHEGMEV